MRQRRVACRAARRRPLLSPPPPSGRRFSLSREDACQLAAAELTVLAQPVALAKGGYGITCAAIAPPLAPPPSIGRDRLALTGSPALLPAKTPASGRPPCRQTARCCGGHGRVGMAKGNRFNGRLFGTLFSGDEQVTGSCTLGDRKTTGAQQREASLAAKAENNSLGGRAREPKMASLAELAPRRVSRSFGKLEKLKLDGRAKRVCYRCFCGSSLTPVD